MVRLREDGSLGPVIDGVFHKGLGSIAERGSRPHVTCSKATPDGRFVLAADPDAEYVKTVNYDVSSLEPMASCPDAPGNTKKVSEVEGTHIDQVHIGSCSNGRFEDIKAAHDILMAAGGKVASTCRTIITPATTEVQAQVVEAGMMLDFLRAGVVFTNPTCSLCTAQHYGALPAGDVGIATNNRNFIGKVGKGSHTYLMSPMAAMASAVNGVITDPRKYL